MELFSSSLSPIKLPLKDADILYFPLFLSQSEANLLFKDLIDNTPWQQDDITVFGKVHKQPRLTALYASNTNSYSYSGITMNPIPFTESLATIKKKVDTVAKTTFTTALLNYYRDGQDSNGWHSDDEPELGKNPVIASISLGAKRPFKLRRKDNKSDSYKIWLEPGSLLLMSGGTQHNWQHQLPKSQLIKDARVNITFRVIV
jgi:alkylated DNA repair dioxygenase AlkB